MDLIDVGCFFLWSGRSFVCDDMEFDVLILDLCLLIDVEILGVLIELVFCFFLMLILV